MSGVASKAFILFRWSMSVLVLVPCCFDYCSLVNLPSQISDCWFNRASRPVRSVRSAAALRHQLKQAAQALTAALASCVSPTSGNFPILWATKIHLEMRIELTLCIFTESCNPDLLLPCHLGSPPLCCFTCSLIV